MSREEELDTRSEKVINNRISACEFIRNIYETLRRFVEQSFPLKDARIWGETSIYMRGKGEFHSSTGVKLGEWNGVSLGKYFPHNKECSKRPSGGFTCASDNKHHGSNPFHTTFRTSSIRVTVHIQGRGVVVWPACSRDLPRLYLRPALGWPVITLDQPVFPLDQVLISRDLTRLTGKTDGMGLKCDPQVGVSAPGLATDDAQVRKIKEDRRIWRNDEVELW